LIRLLTAVTEEANLTGLADCRVSLVSGTPRYPQNPPFDPPEIYPEYPHKRRSVDPSNCVYPMVRESLRLLNLDGGRFGTPEWNPFGEFVRPGHQVLIKPNFVLHLNAGGGPLEAVVTHASVLRPIVDFVLIALQGTGQIIIGDAPQMNCDLATLFRQNGMEGLRSFLTEMCGNAGVSFAVRDFRLEQTFYRSGIVWNRKPLEDAGKRTVAVTLGAESWMDTIDTSRLYGADYDRSATVRAHRAHRHEYKVTSDLLSSDVVISVPKLKVHSKVGTTLNLKNMVGITTDKNHLAHYRVGPGRSGGDEFSNPRWDDIIDRHLSDFLLGRYWKLGKYPFVMWGQLRRVLNLFRHGRGPTFVYGNWHGNDTAWRMALDLNRIVLTSDREGRIHPSPQRQYFSIIDGIVGGDGNGPLHPDAYPSGVVLAGSNPLAVDWVATRTMGFDPARIRMYANAVTQFKEWISSFTTDGIEVKTNRPEWSNILAGQELAFQFRSAPGWRGAVELYRTEPTVPKPDSLDDPILQ
jgi:uncharacterized protein (DUF362 family)